MAVMFGRLARPSVLIFREDRHGRSFLAVRTDGVESWFLPGGKPDKCDLESDVDAAIRETKEETGLVVANLAFWGRFDGIAHRTREYIDMRVYTAGEVMGDLVISRESEIEGMAWLNPRNIGDFPVASILGKQIMPRMTEEGLIY